MTEILQKFRCWKEVEIFNPSSGSNCDLLVVKMENWPNFRFLSVKRHKWCCFFWPDGSFRSLGSNIHSQVPKTKFKKVWNFFFIFLILSKKPKMSLRALELSCTLILHTKVCKICTLFWMCKCESWWFQYSFSCRKS